MNNELKEMLKIIDDKKVHIIAVKDVIEMGTFADTFIVAVAQNERQIQAVINEYRAMKLDTVFIEGVGQDGWVVIQHKDICAHIFTFDQHELYRLDKLYEKQPDIEIK